MQLAFDFCGEHKLMFHMVSARAGYARTAFYHRPPCDHDYFFIWKCKDCLNKFPMSKEEVLINKDKIPEDFDINLNKILTPEQYDIMFSEHPTKEEIDSIMNIIFD